MTTSLATTRPRAPGSALTAMCLALWLAGCGGGASTSLQGNTVVDVSSPAPVTVPPGSGPVTTTNPPGNPPMAAPAGYTVSAVSVAQAGSAPDLSSGSLVIAGDGNLWFSGGFAPTAIGRMTPAGVVSYPVTGAAAAGSYSAGPLTIGPDGNLWFCDPSDGSTLAGAVVTVNLATGVSVKYRPTGISPGAQAYAMANGADGKLWFTEYNGNRIGRFDTVKHTAVEFGPLHAPASAIVAGPDGGIWFAESISANTSVIGRIQVNGPVDKFDPTPDVGTITEYDASPVSGTIIGLATGADGKVWFAKNGFGGVGVGKIDPATGAVTVYPVGLTQSFPQLGGIAAGPDGNIWYTDYYDAAIGRITPTGATLEFATGATGKQLNALIGNRPGDAARSLWLTRPGEASIGRIQVP